MKQTYRFLGTAAEVGTLKFERFGQKVELEPDAALAAQLGGCALIAEDAFKKYQFTAEDLKVWADPFVDPFDVPGVHDEANAKAKFIERQCAARADFAELRQRLVRARRDKEQNPTAHGEMPKAENPTNKGVTNV